VCALLQAYRLLTVSDARTRTYASNPPYCLHSSKLNRLFWGRAWGTLPIGVLAYPLLFLLACLLLSTSHKPQKVREARPKELKEGVLNRVDLVSKVENNFRTDEEPLEGLAAQHLRIR
jgi:hypothetical protein